MIDKAFGLRDWKRVTNDSVINNITTTEVKIGFTMCTDDNVAFRGYNLVTLAAQVGQLPFENLVATATPSKKNHDCLQPQPTEDASISTSFPFLG